MKTISLGECCRFKSGGTPSKARPEFWRGGIPWFSPKDMKSFDLVDSRDHISSEAVSSSATQAVEAGTILVVARSGVLAHTFPVGIIRREAAFNQDIRAILPEQGLDADFVALFLRAHQSYVLAQGVKIGATVHSLRSGFLEALRIPVVAEESQRRIAARLQAQLAAVKQARQAAQAQAHDIGRLVSSILEAAFAATLDAPRIRLGDLSRTTSGSTPSRDVRDYWQPATYPWVRTAEVAFKPIKTTAECISERALAECSLSLLPDGTVLVAMYGQGKTRGQSAVLRVPATTNQACFAVLPSESHDPEYLQFWLWHSYQVLRNLSEARGGNQSNLNGEILNGFEVPIVPLVAQKRIAAEIKEQLAIAEQARQAAQAQLADIAALPARLLAQAFDFTNKEVSP